MFRGKEEKEAFLDGIFKGSNNLPKICPYPSECKMAIYWYDGYNTGKKFFINID